MRRSSKGALRLARPVDLIATDAAEESILMLHCLWDRDWLVQDLREERQLVSLKSPSITEKRLSCSVRSQSPLIDVVVRSIYDKHERMSACKAISQKA